MLAFIVSAFLFSIVFTVVLLLQPRGDNLLDGAIQRAADSARGWIWLYYAKNAALIILPFALLCLVTGAVHPRYSPIESVYGFVLSPYFTSCILGAVFAAVFVVWAYRLYRLGENDPVPRLLKVEGVFLVLLFLIGSSDTFAPYFQRLSAFKLPGAEVSFFQAEKRSNTNDPRTSAKDLILDRAAPSFGLAALQNMPDFMKRDAGYLALMSEQGGGAGAGSIRLVSRTFSAIAACQTAIFTATGNRSFIQQQFEVLLPAIRSYRRAVDYEGKLGAVSTYLPTLEGSDHLLGNALGTVAERTADAGIEVEVVPFEAQTAAGLTHGDGSGPSGSPELQALRSGCAGLLEYPCSPDSLGDPPALRDSPMRAAYCRKICPPPKVADAKQGQGCGLDLSSIAPVDLRYMGDYLAGTFPTLARKALLEEEEGHSDRPYWSLIYASVAAAMGQTDVANHELVTWLSAHAAASGAKAGHGLDWYRVRVLSTLVNITEEASRAAESTPSVIQDFLLESYRRLIAAEDLPFVSEGRKLLLRHADKPEEATADVNPHDSGSCRRTGTVSDDDRGRQVSAAFTQVTGMMNFIDKALDDVDYLADDAPDVIAYLAQLNAIDFSCLSVIKQGGDWQLLAAVNHAEILRLNAKRLLVESYVAEVGKGPDEVRKSLVTAVLDAEAARRLLSTLRQDAITNRRKAVGYFPRIAGSNVIETYDSVVSTLGVVEAKLNAQ